MGTLLPERALDTARQAKHRLFIVRKHARIAAKRAGVHGANLAYRTLSLMKPHTFTAGLYPGEFLDGAPETAASVKPVANVIYCFWTGTNALPPNRVRNLALFRASNAHTEVILVTPDSLPQFIKSGHPLHPAYEHLSLVHKSDYLRAYFMHHYGGGYSDIKEQQHVWLRFFTALADAPDKWVLGFRELSVDMCAQLPGRLGRDLKIHHRTIIGTCAFVMRPGTPFTTEWMDELHARLDFYADALARHPGNERGSNPGYPVPWTGILGDIMQPLCLKYRSHLILDDRIKPSFKNYK